MGQEWSEIRHRDPRPRVISLQGRSRAPPHPTPSPTLLSQHRPLGNYLSFLIKVKPCPDRASSTVVRPQASNSSVSPPAPTPCPTYVPSTVYLGNP